MAAEAPTWSGLFFFIGEIVFLWERAWPAMERVAVRFQCKAIQKNIRYTKKLFDIELCIAYKYSHAQPA
ncbi:hypothetical protein, partial [Escherichia coli]|uniref:hypothetical protein n=1 Tax=Escherichia coli TaxID=562 RepID=UPI00390C98DB